MARWYANNLQQSETFNLLRFSLPRIEQIKTKDLLLMRHGLPVLLGVATPPGHCFFFFFFFVCLHTWVGTYKGEKIVAEV